MSTTATHAIDGLGVASVRRAKEKLCYMGLHGDSLNANKLVVHDWVTSNPGVISTAGYCLGHQLSLVSDDTHVKLSPELDIMNPMYCAKKLLENGTNRQSLLDALYAASNAARIVHGVPPNENLRTFSNLVLAISLGHIFSTTYPSSTAHETHSQLNDFAAFILEHLNGDWSASDKVEHYCYSRVTGQPLHDSEEECRADILLALQRLLSSLTLEQLGQCSTKVWG